MASPIPTIPLADAARTLVANRRHATLAVLEADGIYPYCAAVEYLADDNGDLLFFFSNLASHTKALLKHPQVSASITAGFGEEELLVFPRATCTGTIMRLPDSEDLRRRYLDAFPGASGYIGFADFHFYRLAVERVRYIAGFGRMDWIVGQAYREATPDPLGPAALSAIRHMNADHADNLRDIARHFAGLDWAHTVTMTGLDRLGVDLLVRGNGQQANARVAFPASLSSPAELRPAMVALSHAARDALAGQG